MSQPHSLLAIVSFISRIAQSEFDARTADNSVSWGGRCLDLGRGPQAGYWCHVYADDNGDVAKVEIVEDFVFWPGNPFSDPHDLVYLLLGYCDYHSVDCQKLI